jgi:hypothetical protein
VLNELNFLKKSVFYGTSLQLRLKNLFSTNATDSKGDNQSKVEEGSIETSRIHYKNAAPFSSECWMEALLMKLNHQYQTSYSDLMDAMDGIERVPDQVGNSRVNSMFQTR